MANKNLEPFIKPNAEAWKRYQKRRRRDAIKGVLSIGKKAWGHISRAILWVCAVGGFLLSLIQFLQDQ